MPDAVCVIGDSISGGVVYEQTTDRYTHCPDSFINLLGRELGCEMRNHSKFGCTVETALSRMERYGSEISDCNHTIIMLGGNDSDFDWPAVAAAPEEHHDCKTPLAQFTDIYNRLLDRVLNLGSNPVMLNMIPVYGERYFRWFSQKSDPGSLMRFLHYTTSIEHWNEMYSIAVMKIAARRSIPLIDVRSAFLNNKYFDELFSVDGIHPSTEGHRRIFEFILPQAKEILI